MKWNHKNEIELTVGEMVARRSIAPIQKMLGTLYEQLDKTQNEREWCVRQIETDHAHYNLFVQYVREKLVARCDGSVMSGAFDWRAHMSNRSIKW